MGALYFLFYFSKGGGGSPNSTLDNSKKTTMLGNYICICNDIFQANINIQRNAFKSCILTCLYLRHVIFLLFQFETTTSVRKTKRK